MSRPHILSENKDGKTVELSIAFPKDSVYFDGHFPKMSILPGVAQIHWAITLAAEQFDLQPNVKQMTAIKFSSLIRPDIEIRLRLEYKEDKGQILFAYYNGDTKHSSGTFVLSN
jgi:3-hydroxymyristoyl/3-hydroxydecanoyl-(acyl carrier protein) dehydratase